MYVITGKTDNVVLGMGEALDHMSNGYPRLVNENVAFVTEQVNVNEVDSIPAEVVTDKYCYTTEQGFYLNPDWKEPNKYGISDELLEQIKADVSSEDVNTVLEEVETEVGINEQ